MAEIELQGVRGRMPTYIAEPQGEGPWPGVVIIHDAIGMSSDLRRQADWLAAAGYLAAAPDLFYYGIRLRCLFTTMRQWLKREGPVFEDIGAVRDMLGDRPDCTGRIGIIGFCLGGGFAVLMASDYGFGASSVNYGAVPDDVLAVFEGACPVVGSYGADDRGLRDDPERMRSALAQLGIPHDVKVYPATAHGFLNDHDRSEVPLWSIIMDKLTSSGTSYVKASAMDARERIVTFFDTHLKAPTAEPP
jgi:carboxymethylenebutenolidase